MPLKNLIYYGKIYTVNGKGEKILFSVGEKVVYKTNAVCNVEAIETPVFVKEKDKQYYKLRYLFSSGNEVVYVPVDSDVGIRKVMSAKEAEECFETLRNVEAPDFEPRQTVLLSQHFQGLLSDCSIDGSLMVLKEILLRERKYNELGKKLRQAENHYLAIVEKAVSEEFSVVLGKDVDEMKIMIRQAIYGE